MIDWQGGIVLGVFCAGELLSLPVYRLLRRRFDSGPGRELADIEIWKGALERLVLVGGGWWSSFPAGWRFSRR
ncbi:MAG: hypothetical protein ACFB22_05380 [Rhodothalassiaceae bacterium]